LDSYSDFEMNLDSYSDYFQMNSDLYSDSYSDFGVNFD
jgi:hypothetical protein